MLAANVSKAVSHGLAWRPLPDTVRDMAAWLTEARAAGTYRERGGLTREREQQILSEL